MKAFRFKIDDCINPPRFVWIKEEDRFKAINLARQMYSINKYKVTFTGDENDTEFDWNIG